MIFRLIKNWRNRTSGLGLRTSGLGLRTSGLGLRTSGLGLRTSRIFKFKSLRPTPYAQHPTPYAQHPTPNTLSGEKDNFRKNMRNGYTFLLSVLFVGAIAIAVTGTMLLLGWLTLRNVQIVEQSGRSFELAMTCAEHGLIELFEDGNYAGNEELTRSDGTCNILRTGGSGNENRTLCTEGMSGGSTRRFEIIIERILPSISIFAWQEVELFTSCEY